MGKSDSVQPSRLAPCAAIETNTRGRRYPEPEHPYRGCFQRDRDRILHASAFRRLVYKTQVFVNHEGDLYRTRLTHSLEVAQIARTVAVWLGLNESLTEAICLAHDLGHTPFGHAGQQALNRCMRPWGGFEHNRQSLRVVDELEERYAGFPGLNLCFETREGILKHCSKAEARQLGELGERFLRRRQPGLEAQLANLADEIAYNNHDVDDGLRAGLISVEDLADVRLFRAQFRGKPRSGGSGSRPRQAAQGRHRRRLSGDASPRVRIYQTVRGMVDHVVTDLIETTVEALRAAAPESIDAVRRRSRPLVQLSPSVAAEHLELKQFLHERLYRHERVLAMNRLAARIIAALFACFMHDPRTLPAAHARRARAAQRAGSEAAQARVVADYLAGMTDRYAVAAYRRLVDSTLDW